MDNEVESLTDAELLAAYSKERGTTMTVANLIESHRALIDELNRGQRKEWNDALAAACKQAKAQTLGNNWIEIDRLKQMTMAQLAALLYDGN